MGSSRQNDRCLRLPPPSSGSSASVPGPGGSGVAAEVSAVPGWAASGWAGRLGRAAWAAAGSVAFAGLSSLHGAVVSGSGRALARPDRGISAPRL